MFKMTKGDLASKTNAQLFALFQEASKGLIATKSDLASGSGTDCGQAARPDALGHPCRFPSARLCRLWRLRSSNDCELDQGAQWPLPILCLPPSRL